MEREPGQAGAGPPADDLPERIAYSDSGCDVLNRQQFPSCLACTLAACIHDRLGPRQPEIVRRRRTLIASMAERGRTPAQIARALGVAVRTVRRDLAATRRNPAAGA